MAEYIRIKGAKENNLKSVDVKIPHNSLTVITGVSGSGKSSLAYDVLFKESQRRFLESFSAYSRQYIGKLEKPNVESISGLQAALAINQKTIAANPRSTVGTLSDIYDYLRLLFARIGEIHCHNCGCQISERKNIICPDCKTEMPDVLSRLFSFNSEHGACPECKGLGITEHIDIKKLIADENKTLREGALVPTTPNGYIVYSQVTVDSLNQVCNAHGFNVDIPWKELTPDQKNVILFGSEKIKVLFGKHALESRLKWSGITARPREEGYYKGMIPIMEDILKRDRNDNILRFASSFECESCRGTRLRKEAGSVTIAGRSISDLSEISIIELATFLKQQKFSLAEQKIAEQIFVHILGRINYLDLLGLGYLTLARESSSLSGGESQRIRLAAQLGSGMQGVLYILDEPSIGLHPRDNAKMIEVLKKLRDTGNTVVVVEHDEEMIKAADHLVDIGPGAGVTGGKIIFEGSPARLIANIDDFPLSKTAENYFRKFNIKTDAQVRPGTGRIKINGAKKFNLKNVDVEFKTGAMNVVTGVSGAGKSTLVHGVLGPGVRKKINNEFSELNIVTIESNGKQINRVIEIDQSPIGRTPRSNPATYTKLFDQVRDLFAEQQESKKRKYKKGRFSFNNKGGRCEKCEGAGVIELGMHFMGNVEIVCEECVGKRFNTETLEIKFNDKNIYEVLELSIEEAFEFFTGHEKITRILNELIKLDVGYLKLGQPSTTLSGGEAQRVKLASELYKTSREQALYILDEPTVGLHKADIKYLQEALNEIVDKGNTVVVIEHDLDIINSSDWIVDLGPGGGELGGGLVAMGTPLQLFRTIGSYTGEALRNACNAAVLSENTKPDLAKPENIQIKNISTNNLKNVDVEIPLNEITVFTGVSGSGKSSLAFDTIYSESRNKFTQGFSTYARRMMKKLQKPELEESRSLTPAIAIEQKQFGKNPRSTVATASDIYDLLRLLYSRAGVNSSDPELKYPASMFSFNNHNAACPACKGLGLKITTTEDKLITDRLKPFNNGAMDGHNPGKYFGDPYGQFVNTLLKVGELKGIDFSIPFEELDSTAKEVALYGTGGTLYDVEWKFKRGGREGSHKMKTAWKGFINYVNEDYLLKHEGKRGDAYKAIMCEVECDVCRGRRLKDEILQITFCGKNISEIVSMEISEAILFFSEDIKAENRAVENIIGEIKYRLNLLNKTGLGYLALHRATSSLSGGEAQRLRISTQLGADLCGLTYILDEPTIGLHAKDKERLIALVKELRDRGNTVLIVEHDTDFIKAADNIVELGPGAGNNGGQIVASGKLENLNPEISRTAKYIQSGIKGREKLKTLMPGIEIKGAEKHNLKMVDVKIPSGGIIAVTGVSGSGKSTLLFDVIYESYKSGSAAGCMEIKGFEKFDNIVAVDQSPISTSLLSTTSTFTGLSDLTRDIFAGLPDAKNAGLGRSNFSVNTKGGRCEECKGLGKTKVAMDFLADVWVTCDKCGGKRFNENILDVYLKGKNINDILNSSVNELIKIFADAPKLIKGLRLLEEVGLGYLQFGQTTNTLSGGECQRLKLAAELIKSRGTKNLYILDEPTTGLFFSDIEILLSLLDRLVKTGNTVVVIEHNMDVLNNSDWIIELGPGGGVTGGEIIFNGPVKN